MKYLYLAVVLWLTACSAPKSAKNPPQLEPPAKILQQCRPVLDALNVALAGDREVSTAIQVSHDGTCALQLSVVWGNGALPKLAKVKATFGTYTQFSYQTDEGIQLATLWLTEPRNMFVPVLDPVTGEKLSTLETAEECEATATRLRQDFGEATATVRTMPENSGMRCYVELKFTTEAAFEKFFAWSNPYSWSGELTHMHYQRPTGVVATVLIRPLSGSL